MPLGPPFGRRHGGGAAVWPAWTGPARLAVLNAVPPDPWLIPPDDFDGGTALEDLVVANDARDAARVLARYLVVRLIRGGFAPAPGFVPALDRAAANAYLQSLPAGDADRLALAPFLEVGPADGLDRPFFVRVAAAAATAVDQAHHRCAFALLHAGYSLAADRRRHREAARLARALASLASDRASRTAARRWGQRARAHERRTSD